MIHNNSITNVLQKNHSGVSPQEILKGLYADQKFISSKYFYDKKGSMLFEKITDLDEYYLTRTEKTILRKDLPGILNNVADTAIIELGSGDCSKISIVFESIKKKNLDSITYMPVDVSITAIEDSMSKLSGKYPEIKINGYIADFMHQFDFFPRNMKKIICFFGSTIGNLSRRDSISFLRNVSNNMQIGDQLILGIDRVKDIEILENAYNDGEHVTSEFNKNILNVVNDLIKSDFDLEKFEHFAFFNEKMKRIEMHLRAKENMVLRSKFFKNNLLSIQKDETIHTENSYKFDKDHINNMVNSSDLNYLHNYTDENNWFSILLFQK